MSQIASLSVQIGANIDDFKKSMDSVQKATQEIGKTVSNAGKGMTKWVTGPMALAGGALLGLAVKTGNYADRILDLHSITGMSTQSIQEWQSIAKMAGVNTEAVTNASKALTRQMSSMRDGTGKQAEALKELGIAYEDLEKASPDERMNMLISALQGVEDPAKRAEWGTDLLRGSFEEIAPIVGMTTEEMEAFRQKAHESGAVMSDEALEAANEFRINMELLKQEFTGIANTIASEFMPILVNDIAPFIQNTVVPLLKDFAERISVLIDWFMGLSPEMQQNILIAIGLVAALGPILVVVGKIISIIGVLIPVIKALGVALMTLAANPVGLVIIAIAGLIAIGIALWKNWDKVKEFGMKIWGYISGFLDTTIGKVVAVLMGPIGIGLLIIKNWDKIKQASSRIWGAIVGYIRGQANQLIGIANSIIGAYERMINAVGGAINRIPSFSVPDWVPGIGGREFSLPKIPTISLPKIPSLAIGTNEVFSDGLAMIHKGEAIVPADVAKGGYSGEGGNTTIIVELDGRQIAKGTLPHMANEIRLKTGLRI